MIKRKYKITTSSGTHWLTPVNDQELVYKWKKSSTINFTKVLETKLLFHNDSKFGITDFDILYGFEKNIETRCEEITCQIYKVCGGQDILEYTGVMPLKTGDWDLDRCTVAVSLEPVNGIYDCINDHKKDVRVIFSDWTPLENDGPNTSNNCPQFFLYDKIGADFVFMNPSIFTVGGLTYSTKFSPIGSGTVRYPHGTFASLCYNLVQLLLFECGREACLPMIKSDFFDWNAPGDTVGYVASTTPKLPLNMARENYPSGIGGGGADGPGYCNRWIFNPITPGINYVTGQPNKLTNLFFMPKSNANNNTAAEWEEPVTPGFEGNSNAFSFSDLEQIWATMFDAHWFIDTDGCMRVEHISWFNNAAITYNTTTGEHATLNEYNKKYSYKDELLPRKEIFLFSANRDKLNGRVDYFANYNNQIIYDKICVSQNKENEEKSYALKLVTTDINGIDSKNNGNAEYYNNEGIMLFTSEFGTYFDLRSHGSDYKFAQIPLSNPSEVQLNVASLTTYPNGHLQWSNLIRRYLKNGRVLPQGLNGAEIITFNARTVKTKKQVDVFLKWCCSDGEFQPNQAQVITSLGNGDIEEAEYNTKTNIIKIKTLHD